MFIHYTNSISAHQLPLDRAIINIIGSDNFYYIYTNESLQGGAQEINSNEKWICKFDSKTNILLKNAEIVLVGGLRPINVIEHRLAEGKITLYMSERWFKPIPIFNEWLWLPGWLKLLYPPYFIMALRFAFLFKSKKYRYLPIGPHAAKDMALICNIFFPFRFKKIKEIRQSFIPWGDFVEKSKYDYFAQNKTPELKVLYIGRLLKLKHIDDIIRAVKLLSNVKLLIVGNGPDEIRLKKIANNQISFHNAVSLDQVREVMRAHDVVVFASNAFDGWGAVVQEALSERVPVFGTYEAGASAAILPESQLFHCGDYKTLSKMLLKLKKYKENTNANFPSDTYLSTLPSDYTPDGAAKRLLNIIKKM